MKTHSALIANQKTQKETVLPGNRDGNSIIAVALVPADIVDDSE